MELTEAHAPSGARPEIWNGAVLADAEALRELSIITESIVTAQRRICDAQAQLAYWIRQSEMLLSVARPEVTGLTFQLWQHKSSKKLYAVRGRLQETEQIEPTALAGPFGGEKLHADLRSLAYDPGHEDLEWLTKYPHEFQKVK